MARGKRSDRTGSSGSRPKAADSGVPENYETVEFEELPDSTVPAEAQHPAAGGGTAGDTERTDVMAEPVDPREPEVEVAATSEPAVAPPPPKRGGGFWAGLLGGLLGGAAVVGGGSWYAYEHGPLKPALARLDSTEAAGREAANALAALGGKLDQQGAELAGKLDQQGTALTGKLDQQAAELTGVEATLQQADGAIASLGDRLAAANKANEDLGIKVQQADTTFRAASEQVIGRLEAVNAKLVEVEQNQPADVVDKQTVADIAGKQAAIEQGQKDVSGALARVEQMVSQSLEAGNKQAAATQTMVAGAQSRMEEIAAQQRDLLAMRAELDRQATTIQEQATALSDATAQLQAFRRELQDQVQSARSELQEQMQGARSELQQQVQGTRSELRQQLADTSSRLTTEGAARERSVGLSLATNSLDASLQTGQPFEPTINTLRQLARGDEVVQGVADTLEPMAATGIPTASSL